MTGPRVTTRAVDAAHACAFVMVVTVHEGRLLLSRHRDRSTWETQGGHVEPGETTRAAAARELYEESGVVVRDLAPVCDVWVDGDRPGAWGRLYAAAPERQDALPASEIAEARWFRQLPAPEELTYPWLTPLLVSRASAHSSH
ncbi:NUDIX hydrolase [Actinomyces haliotis]|uniref:NUDIX hydrolase n=1 Tax=Actinomyces haliotis TaxID=1280843 RepID=UPI002B26E973|nr:NUDIX domain-containing protein [Actinomyces haliotis]